jgi:hypothetical protein
MDLEGMCKPNESQMDGQAMLASTCLPLTWMMMMMIIIIIIIIIITTTTTTTTTILFESRRLAVGYKSRMWPAGCVVSTT